MSTDYEVLGLTSGDWPLSRKFSYIGRSFISLWGVLRGEWHWAFRGRFNSRAGSVLHDYSSCRRLGTVVPVLFDGVVSSFLAGLRSVGSGSAGWPNFPVISQRSVRCIAGHIL